MAKKNTRGNPAEQPSESGGDGADQPRKPRNIVLCSDGTGNSGGKARGTNVWELFNSVRRHPDADGKLPEPRQTAYYDDGVGTQKFILFKALGGALGVGYSRNIRQLYKALVLAYEPGDSIYLFGFSRGAYTVRCLAGLILKCGILNRHEFKSSQEMDRAILQLFRFYRHSYKSLAGAIIRLFRPKEAETYWAHRKSGHIHDIDAQGEVTTRIHFIGVWDTVDAVGLPSDKLSDLLNLLVRFRFRDYKLHANVDKACHAVAIDDERRTFWPVMWNEKGEKGDRIEQVWFAGVHTNVGGGYPKNQLALVTLDWMMEKAKDAGLQLYSSVRDQVRAAANVHGKLYDSRAGLSAYYRYHPRDFAQILNDPDAGVENGVPQVHFSAVRRAARATGDYAPANLPDAITVVHTYREDKKLAKKLQTAFDATKDQRREGLEPVVHLVNSRRGLYHAFIIFSIALVALGALFKWCPLAPQLTEQAVLPAEAQWIFTLGGLVLPDFITSFFGPLIDYLKVKWGYALAAGLFFALLVGLKMHWEKSSRHLSLNSWRSFRETLYNGKKP